LTEEQLTSPEFYKKLRESKDYKDPEKRNDLELQITNRARELRVTMIVKEQLKKCERIFNQTVRQQVNGVTAFTKDITGKEYPDLFCGNWIATDDGIESMETSRTNQKACYHPILPVKRLRNIETGEEQIIIAFKRDGIWNEFPIPKDTIASARSIVALSKYGVAVTSENAKLLVKYLNDVECMNDDVVALVRSSSKLGWHNGSFLPYDQDVDKLVLDASNRFQQICNAIKTHGSYEVWLDHARKIRASKYIEPRILLAASFSSAIIPILNIASVLVDESGLTEAGKTVAEMLAASVWACPDEGQYMGDFLTTDTELEVRCDFLNNMPVILDDTSKMKKNIRENIEQIVYNFASGSGKKRSNIDLGSERVRTWKTTFIISGERPLSSFVNQGGALNRIIEIDLTGTTLFDSPSVTADIVRSNYGFAGPDFIQHLKEIDKDEIRKMHRKYSEELTTDDTMQKQVISMAAILTADAIATKVIFRDGKNLRSSEVSRFLTNRRSIEEGARCYEYLIGVYEASGQHFDLQFNNIDQWGEVKRENGETYINFNIVSFEKILSEKDFSRKAFTSWADRNKLLRHDKGRDTYTIRGSIKTGRVISVKIVNLDEYEQEKGMFL